MNSNTFVNEDLASESNLRTHYWLRVAPDVRFHAYLSAKPGSVSMCGRGEPLRTLREADIPGDRSKCCGHCCEALYPGMGYGSMELT